MAENPKGANGRSESNRLSNHTIDESDPLSELTRLINFDTVSPSRGDADQESPKVRTQRPDLHLVEAPVLDDRSYGFAQPDPVEDVIDADAINDDAINDIDDILRNDDQPVVDVRHADEPGDAVSDHDAFFGSLTVQSDHDDQNNGPDRKDEVDAENALPTLAEPTLIEPVLAEPPLAEPTLAEPAPRWSEETGPQSVWQGNRESEVSPVLVPQSARALQDAIDIDGDAVSMPDQPAADIAVSTDPDTAMAAPEIAPEAASDIASYDPSAGEDRLEEMPRPDAPQPVDVVHDAGIDTHPSDADSGVAAATGFQEAGREDLSAPALAGNFDAPDQAGWRPAKDIEVSFDAGRDEPRQDAPAALPHDERDEPVAAEKRADETAAGDSALAANEAAQSSRPDPLQASEFLESPADLPEPSVTAPETPEAPLPDPAPVAAAAVPPQPVVLDDFDDLQAELENAFAAISGGAQTDIDDRNDIQAPPDETVSGEAQTVFAGEREEAADVSSHTPGAATTAAMSVDMPVDMPADDADGQHTAVMVENDRYDDDRADQAGLATADHPVFDEDHVPPVSDMTQWPAEFDGHGEPTQDTQRDVTPPHHRAPVSDAPFLQPSAERNEQSETRASSAFRSVDTTAGTAWEDVVEAEPGPDTISDRSTLSLSEAALQPFAEDQTFHEDGVINGTREAGTGWTAGDESDAPPMQDAPSVHAADDLTSDHEPVARGHVDDVAEIISHERTDTDFEGQATVSLELREAFTDREESTLAQDPVAETVHDDGYDDFGDFDLDRELSAELANELGAFSLDDRDDRGEAEKAVTAGAPDEGVPDRFSAGMLSAHPSRSDATFVDDLAPEPVPRPADLSPGTSGRGDEDGFSFQPMAIIEQDETPEMMDRLPVPDLARPEQAPPAQREHDDFAFDNDYDFELEDPLSSPRKGSDGTHDSDGADPYRSDRQPVSVHDRLMGRDHSDDHDHDDGSLSPTSYESLQKIPRSTASRGQSQTEPDFLSDDFDQVDWMAGLAGAASTTPDADQQEPSADPGARSRPRLVAAGVLGLAVLGAAAAVGYSFFSGNTGDDADGPLVIAADPGPVKVQPEDPGGRVVPNQDNAVYGRVEGDNADQPRQQELVTTVEEPVDLAERTGNADEIRIDGYSLDDLPGVFADKIEERIAEEVDERLARVGSSDPTQPANATDSAVVDGLVAPRRVRTVAVTADGRLIDRPAPTLAPPQTGETTAAPPAELVPAAPAPESPTLVQTTPLSTGENVPLASAETAPATASEAPVEPPVDGPSAETAEAAADDPVETAALPADEPVPAAAPVPNTRPATPQTVTGAVAQNAGSEPLSEPQAARETAAAEQQASVSPAPSAPAATAQAAQPAGNPGGYFVQIASQPSEAAARESYANLSARYSAIIGDLGVDYQTANIPDRGTFHRVRIPAGTRANAIALCERYQAAGGACFVAR